MTGLIQLDSSLAASVDPTESGYLPRDDIALGEYRVMVCSAAPFGPRLGPSPFDTLYVPVRHPIE
jgi:hypothetical protein